LDADYSLLRLLLFRIDPEQAHRLTLRYDKLRRAFQRAIPPEKTGIIRAGGRNWREPFLYYFRDNVEFEYRISEIDSICNIWLR
jgi:hypothetical protein